jgi:hypothetical protein
VDGLICDFGAQHIILMTASCAVIFLYVTTFSATEAFLQVSSTTRFITYSPFSMLHITVSKVIVIFSAALASDQPAIFLAIQAASNAFAAGVSRTTDTSFSVSIIAPDTGEKLAGLRYKAIRVQPREGRGFVFSSSPLASRLRRTIFLSSMIWALAELVLYISIDATERAAYWLAREERTLVLSKSRASLPLFITASILTAFLIIECTLSALLPTHWICGGPVPLLCRLAGLLKISLLKTTATARLISLMPDAPKRSEDKSTQTVQEQDSGADDTEGPISDSTIGGDINKKYPALIRISEIHSDY